MIITFLKGMLTGAVLMGALCSCIMAKMVDREVGRR